MSYQQKMQEETTTGQFRSLVEENKVMTCDHRTTAKQTLAGLGTSYQTIEVNRMKSGPRQRTVPAVFICGRAVPGTAYLFRAVPGAPHF
jgi:glutaredoxin